MSLRSHILFMLIATVIAWVSWLLVLTNINPYETAWWGFALFYVSLFLSFFGSFTVLGFVTRTLVQFRRHTTQYRTATALRQAFLWSLALVIALALQSQRLLSWWIFAVIVVIFALIEFSSISIRRSQHQ